MFSYFSMPSGKSLPKFIYGGLFTVFAFSIVCGAASSIKATTDRIGASESASSMVAGS